MGLYKATVLFHKVHTTKYNTMTFIGVKWEIYVVETHINAT